MSNNKRNLYFFRAIAFIALVALGMHGQAHAMSCGGGPNPSTATVTVPTGTYGVPRDAPVGFNISGWTPMQINSTSMWTSCSGAANEWIGLATRLTIPRLGTVTMTDGSGTFSYYDSGVPGVGMVVGVNSYNTGTGWWGNAPGYGSGPNWSAVVAWASSGAWSGQSFGMRMDVAWVKVGPVSAGTSQVFGTVGQAGPASAPFTNPLRIVDINFIGTANFTVLSCTTPNVSVDLGTHSSTEFAGIGTPASGAVTSFTIALNACPSGMNTIQYRIDPTTALVYSTQSVVALDTTSSATGVGVQLLNNAGTSPFPLQSWQSFGGYSQGSGGSYTLPLKARYYQTGATISGGSANTAMTFTMQYQ